MNQLEHPFTLLRYFAWPLPVTLLTVWGIFKIAAYDFLTKAQSPVQRVLIETFHNCLQVQSRIYIVDIILTYPLIHQTSCWFHNDIFACLLFITVSMTYFINRSQMNFCLVFTLNAANIVFVLTIRIFHQVWFKRGLWASQDSVIWKRKVWELIMQSALCLCLLLLLHAQGLWSNALGFDDVCLISYCPAGILCYSASHWLLQSNQSMAVLNVNTTLNMYVNVYYLSLQCWSKDLYISICFFCILPREER